MANGPQWAPPEGRPDDRPSTGRRVVHHVYWVAPVALIIVAGFVIGTLGIASMATTAITTASSERIPPGVVDGGIPVGDDDADTTVTVYVDYLCPFCGDFETANGETLADLVTSGTVRLDVHPVAILNSRSNGTQYSERAANAAVCVASYEPSAFLAMNAELFTDQPAEGDEGHSDDELIAMATEAGADSDKVADCITTGKFRDWVLASTREATSTVLPGGSQPLTGTPTVIVDGQEYTGSLTDVSNFTAFLEAHLRP